MELHDLAAAYALDALDPEERWTYEQHLRTCERCRAELTVLRDSATDLAYGVDGAEPRADLRDRIITAARAEPRTAAVVPFRRRWLFPATAAAAVAAACAAIGLGLWANSLRDGTGQRLVEMTGGGTLVVDDGEASVLACVSAPPAGKTYEAWVIRDDRPQPAGLFGGGCRPVPLEVPVEDGDVVAVTLEDAGGAEAPTGAPLMAANV